MRLCEVYLDDAPCMVAGYPVPFAWTGCPSMVGGRNIGEVVRIKSPRKKGRIVMVVEGIFPFE